MIKIATFHKHHDEIRDIVRRIKSELNYDKINKNPGPIVKVVRELFGKFSIHLMLEDSMLYPELITSNNSSLSAASIEFKLEMDVMKDGFESYKKKWAGPVSIASNPLGFIDETVQLLISLDKRINREEAELYKMVDELC